MRRRFVLPCVLLVLTAGCFGGGAEDPTETPDSSSPDATGNETSEPGIPSVFVSDFPIAVNASEPINITWEVDPGNDTVMNITHTAVHYANHSVDDPQSPADYGNATDIQSGEIPGEFNASFTVEAEGTIYLRAHANVAGTDVWSVEFAVEVGANAPAGERFTVTIGNTTSSFLANYDPRTITLSVGDEIVWYNMDDFPHSATSDTGAPAAFNTGSLAAGTYSEPVQFLEPGTYNYHCSVHSTMSGQLGGVIEVEA